MKNIKNQKGAISLFVVLAMLFFLAFMLGVFAMVNRRNASQLEAVRETAKIYASGSDANTIYDSMIATSSDVVIPITTFEQLKKVKEITGTATTANYTINGKLYTYKSGANYMLANDIILDFSSEIDGKTTVNIYDYMLYDTETYNIYMNNHNIYYKLSDGSLWKCIFYQKIQAKTSASDSTIKSDGFADKTSAGKSYLSNKYSILDNGIEEFKNTWSDTTNYEFLLTYNCSDRKFDITNKKYQRWRQTNNPTKENIANKSTEDEANATFATGYTVNFDGAVTGIGTTNYWGGLTLSTSSACYINGSVGYSDWYYAIGVFSNSFHGTYGIPTANNNNNNNNNTASECLLFVRAK